MTTIQNIDAARHDLLVILRHAPHGSAWLREGLEVALVAAAFGKRVALMFQADGVYALMAGQQAGALGQKGTHPQIAMLEMYDIETLWVSEEALLQRGLEPDDLMLPVTLLDSRTLAHVTRENPYTLVF
ncbi:sulfurtransferase complex subunit TusC [Salinicola rhizosphaerae]|uniref:Sulfurtransferase TusC n=1 Tax=Salinicola rhizosphaerae TaxID=1443141 RepID=A0ABQ3DPA5_9GAMM|nr:sulfurtransferase complex subunit TusC [Salinicola rhizosphaerae]GHB08989.1 sulfurtransferase TusC [Salinicola rhizosphaerae]